METKGKNTAMKLVAGSLLSTALMTAISTQANAESLYNYSDLGSGAEIRSELLNDVDTDVNTLELTCGGSEKTAEGKCGEGKCGEGKCGGDDKKAKKDKKKKKKKKKADKTSEHKCGEGKCGEGKCGGN